MGTSSSSGGSRPTTPLVPTWLDDLAPEPLPDQAAAVDPNHVNDDPSGADVSGAEDAAPRPPVEPPPEPDRFRRARADFSRFAGSGGADSRALRRAVKDYVRSGAGGSRSAVKRLGHSRTAAINTLGILRSIQRDGVQATLLYLNLGRLVGSSPADVFLGITEVVCRDGSSLDEAIARNAWLNTVSEIDQLGIIDLESLTVEQIHEIFLSFIAHAIEALLFHEIGINGFRYAGELGRIESFQEQLRNYIQRAVRDSFHGDLRSLSSMSDADIRVIVDKTFQEAWELLELWGDKVA